MIEYLTGDATNPDISGKKYIVHVCNDLGFWGRGFVIAISAKWSLPEKQYKEWSRNQFSDFGLGKIQVVNVEDDISVINMIAQEGVFRVSVRKPPIRYPALEECLTLVADHIKETGGSVHMPRIGCGLAGGKWDKVEPIINKTLILAEIPTFVYDLA